MSAKFSRIPLSSIHVGERQRPIEKDHAEAIAASMAERGLINPITVRNTPNQNKGKTPYTLVAGGHRLEGARANGWAEIEAMIVDADAGEAVLIEIAENLMRNELTALNRALFVAKYREVWEEVHGQIQRGGNTFVTDAKGSKGHDGPLVFAPGKELSERVQDRLGISHRTYKRISQIAMNLHPALREAIRGTDIEDDQTKLLKLASFEPDLQYKAAAIIKRGADYATALSLMQPKQEPSPIERQKQLLDRMLSLWAEADAMTRSRFLSEVKSRPFQDDVASDGAEEGAVA